MLLLVHTVLSEVGYLILRTQYYHALLSVSGRLRFELIRKKLHYRLNHRKAQSKSNRLRSHQFKLVLFSPNCKMKTISTFKCKPRVLSSTLTKQESNVQGNSKLNAQKDSQKMWRWSAEEAAGWLASERLSAHLATLAPYSGADLLCFSLEDLMRLCGVSDGLRLYNALRRPPTAKTLYVSMDGRFFTALYLSSPTLLELRTKLATALSLAALPFVLVTGPHNIRVIASDELVFHLADNSVFTIQLISAEDEGGNVQVLLVPVNFQ